MIDFTVVGSGPNGLAAAVTAARAGLQVRVIEAGSTLGGGLRTAELTLPGFHHDVCAAVHPAAVASPFFNATGLLDSIDWITPAASFSHPLTGGRAATAWLDLNRTADGLGADGAAWKSLIQPILTHLDGVVDMSSHSLVRQPPDIAAAATFVKQTARTGLTKKLATGFKEEYAPALLTGAIAHVPGRHPSLASAGAGLLITAHAHAGGWGFPRGGSQRIADVMIHELQRYGTEFVTETQVNSLADLPPSTATILATAPNLLLSSNLPSGYRRALGRFRYGPGAAKVDFALSGPVPWTNTDVSTATTVHLGGTRSQIIAAENQVQRGHLPETPYVLVVQHSVVDPTRAPHDKATLWAYTHVPPGSGWDPTAKITEMIEQYAPGFRDTILATHSSSAQDLAAYNPSYLGGDFGGGAVNLRQLVARPNFSRQPWRTPLPGVYLGSASTPPGPAVHGMGGWLAAKLALNERFGI